MPPPFQLLTYEEHHPMDFRKKMTYFSKQGYLTPMIKTSFWDNYLLSRPIDNDPFCPAKYNLLTAHYKRLGLDKKNYWSTAYSETYKPCSLKEQYQARPHKPFINVQTTIEPDEPKEECSPDDCVDYSSVYRSTFIPPHPYIPKKDLFPVAPFLANRRLACHPKKFMDDDYTNYIKQLQVSNSQKYVSYNPMTTCYTDGTTRRK